MSVRYAYQRRSRRMACSMIQQLRYPMDDKTFPNRLSRHEASCLYCQADAIRHRQIMRGLREMTSVTEALPYDLVAAMDEDDLTEPPKNLDELSSRRRPSRAAVAASIAAIGVAVVAGRRLRSA